MTSTLLKNNFDLLRLFAALQVFYFHTCPFLILKPGPIHARLARIYSFFPGVSIFFVISGFLITLSYKRNNNFKEYIRNRALRIYPALWSAFVLSLLLLCLLRVSWSKEINTIDIWSWVFTHVTGFVYLIPLFAKEYGIEVLNGSLFTIPAELQFYFLLPCFLFCWHKVKSISLQILLGITLIIISSSLGYGLWFHKIELSLQSRWLLLGSALPNFYMFYFGIFGALYFNKIEKLIKGKVLFWSFIYIGWRLLLRHSGLHVYQMSYSIVLINNLLLAIFTLSAAFSFTSFYKNSLQNIDISYGVYLYHGLVLHAMVYMQLTNRWIYFFLSLGITIFLAFFSWKFIEKPFLKKKRNSLRQYP